MGCYLFYFITISNLDNRVGSHDVYVLQFITQTISLWLTFNLLQIWTLFWIVCQWRIQALVSFDVYNIGRLLKHDSLVDWPFNKL